MDKVIKFCFSFAGRITRTQFVIGVVSSALLLLWACLGAPLPHFLWVVVPSAVLVALRYVLFATAKVVGAISFASFHVRRMHDRGLSGWWMLATLVWYVFGGFLVARLHPGASIAITLLPMPTWILTLLPGSKGENRFG